MPPSLPAHGGGRRQSSVFLGLRLHPPVSAVVTWPCSLCVHLYVSSLLIRTPAIGLGSTPIQYDFTLTNYIYL